MSMDLQALMMPVSDDEQMKALAQSLRGRQTAADFFSASSIPNLQRMAQSEQEYIQNVGNRQGVLREALERRKQDQEQHREGVRLREAMMTQTADYQKQMLEMQGRQLQGQNDRADQAAAIDVYLANQKAAQDAANPKRELGPVRPAAKAVEEMAAGQLGLETIQEMQAVINGMTDEELAELNQPKAEIMLSAIENNMPEGAGNYVAGKVFPSEKVRNYRNRGLKMESDLTRALSGVAVTQYEGLSRQRWSPLAPGLTREDRELRLRNLADSVNDKVAINLDMYPGYFPHLEELAVSRAQGNVQPSEDTAEVTIEDVITGIDDGTINIDELPMDVQQAVEEYLQSSGTGVIQEDWTGGNQ